jgi:PAS domain S-box-containing protein
MMNQRHDEQAADSLAFLAGGGEMGERTRAFDWSKTPLGPSADWPQSLKTAVSICIGSRSPMFIWWGNPAYTMFYNDAYIFFQGVAKDPDWLGRSARECWSEVWFILGPLLDRVFTTGEATCSEDLPLELPPNLSGEEGYFSFSYNPIRDDAGAVGGIFFTCYGASGRAIGERRNARELENARRLELLQRSDELEIANRRLREAHELFQAIYQQGMFAARLRLDGTVIDANDSSLRACGFAREDVIDRPFWECGWWNRSSAVLEWIRRAVLQAISGVPFRGESIYFWADGSEHVVDFAAVPIREESGHVAAVVVTGMDITEHVQGELNRRQPESDHAADERLRVLVADDNSDMRQYVVRLLAEHYKVEAVADGESALAAAFERPPDLILTDVMMPRLDGFGLLRRLRADPRTRSLPVIMLSARAGEESRVEGMEAGADDYLVKPFSGRELLARVSAYLQLARLRQDASEPLRRSEERLRMALTAARMVAWHFEPATGKVVMSDNAADVFGQPRGTQPVSIDQAFNLVHPDDVKRHAATVQKAIDECGSYVSQFRMIRPEDGEIVWLEERGHGVREGQAKADRLLGVVLDITERKRAEDEARKVQDIFKLVHGIGRIGHWEWNSVTDENKWSSEIEALYGLPPGGFDGSYQAWVKLIHPDDLVKAEEDVRHAFQTGKYFTEFRVIWPDGSVHWLEARAFVFKDGHDKPVRIAGVNMDVTERKRIEEALRDADRRKDEFLATLAHELRNPLATLRNGLQLLRMAGAGKAMADNVREMMERQLGQLVRLIDDLMDVGRISQGKLELRRERVALDTVLTCAMETSRPLIEEMGHDLQVVLPKQPIVIDADPIRLTQVFMNLLNNAAKYSDRNGKIWLTVERQGSDVVVSVRDAGIGLAADQLPRIFELFSQVDLSLERSQGGLGIGLSLVKRLLEMHGGNVEVRSEGPGHGSEFIVRLPVDVEASVPQPEREKQPGEPRTTLRILIVDDNRDGADSLSMMLRIMGNDIRTAYDGEEAVAAAEKFQPAVILLDIGLPKLNGYEACRRIRALPGGNGSSSSPKPAGGRMKIGSGRTRRGSITTSSSPSSRPL